MNENKWRALISSKKENMTDDDVFYSPKFLSLLNQLIKYITEKKEAIRTKIVNEPGCVAFTDGEQVFYNPKNPITQTFPTLKLKINSVLGFIFHEIGHLLYSNFELRAKFLKAVEEEGVFNASYKNKKAMKEVQDYIKKYPSLKGYFAKVLADISNIVEDIFIETMLKIAYKGTVASCITLNREKSVELYKSLKEMVDADFNSENIMLNLILSYASCGEINNWQGVEDEHTECLDKIKDDIDYGVSQEYAQGRINASVDIFLGIWSLLKKDIDETFENMQQALNNMSNNSGDGDENSQSVPSTDPNASNDSSNMSALDQAVAQELLKNHQNNVDSSSVDNDVEKNSSQFRGKQPPVQSKSQNKSSKSSREKNSSTNEEESNSPQSNSNLNSQKDSSSSKEDELQTGNSNSNEEMDNIEKANDDSNDTSSEDEINAESSSSSGENDSSEEESESLGDSSSSKNDNSKNDAEEGSDNDDEKPANVESNTSNSSTSNDTDEDSNEETEESSNSSKNSANEEDSDLSDSVNSEYDEKTNSPDSSGESGNEDGEESESGSKESEPADTSSESNTENGDDSDCSPESTNNGGTDLMDLDDTAEDENDSSDSEAMDSEFSVPNSSLESEFSSSMRNIPRFSRSSGEAKDSEGDGTTSYEENQSFSEDGLGDSIISTINSIAQELVEEELVEQEEGELRKLLTKVPFTDIHKNVSFRIIRHTDISDKDIRNYNSMKEVVKYSKALQKEMERVLKNKDDSLQKNLFIGKKISKTPYDRHGRIFTKRNLPSDAELAVSILVDMSGSMHGDRIEAAIALSVILEDFCSAFDIPLSVAGHHTGYGDCVYHVFKNFDDVDGKDKYRLMQLHSTGANRDGAALQFCGEHLLTRPEEKKLLILISDGQPADSGYHGDAAENDLRQIKSRLKNRGVELFAAAIGSDKDVLKRIYKDNFLNISDLKNLPKTMVRLVENFME